MSSFSPGDAGQSVPLSSRLRLQVGNQWQGTAVLGSPTSAVLGGEDGTDVTAGLSEFSAAEPPIVVEASRPPSAVLGEDEPQTAVLEYAPEESAVYALMQVIETPDGLIYDFTLPLAGGDDGMVLGGRNTLRFPVNAIALDVAPAPGEPHSAVLGIEDLIGGAIGGAVGGAVVKRVLQVIKAPFEKSILEAIRKTEGEPWVGMLGGDAQWKPFQGAETWRAALKPATEQRVLLLVHGFGSSLAGSNEWLAALGKQHGYDAVIGYNHPTIWCDPAHNAAAMLELIPEDMRLNVDIIAHSRGGLVSRSLVELVEPNDRINVGRIVTCGTPHGGTPLADPERWDRLVSIGMTAASWLAASAGAAVMIPRVLEMVLKAASQIVFDLPGLGAMTPGGAYMTKLNSVSEVGSGFALAQGRARYSAVTSRFSVFSVDKPAFQQAFATFAAQAFFDKPNDLVVPTGSMTAIDDMGLVPRERQLLVANDHFSYFRDRQVLDFIAARLGE